MKGLHFIKTCFGKLMNWLHLLNVMIAYKSRANTTATAIKTVIFPMNSNKYLWDPVIIDKELIQIYISC